MRGRRCQFDVAHALAPHFRLRDFDTALFADHATMLEALVLTAQAFVVLDRTENLGAEQAIALRLEGAVVDGLRLLDLAVGPGTDFVRGSQTDGDCVEFLFGRQVLLEQVCKQAFHVCFLLGALAAQ
jgi:hypothetical protein